MDPFFKFPKSVDNKALGESPLWPEVRDCKDADNCRNCGKCTALLKACFKDRAETSRAMAQTFSKFFKG